MPKHDLRVEAYGTVDEANAAIGLVRLHLSALPDLDAMLGASRTTCSISAPTCCTPEREGAPPPAYEPLRIIASQVDRLERDIDSLNADLAPLRSFVLPAVSRQRPICTSRGPSRGGRNGRWWSCRRCRGKW